MRFGKGLSTLKNCTVTEGKHNKEMENAHGLWDALQKKEEEKKKEKKFQKR